MLHQSLSDSVKIISIDRPTIMAALRDIARRMCAEHAEVKSVRLFGSIARGDQVGMSDVDILMVLDDSAIAREPLERIRLFYHYFDLPMGVDLLVYPESEITRRLQAGDPFMVQLWAESLVLEDRGSSQTSV